MKFIRDPYCPNFIKSPDSFIKRMFIKLGFIKKSEKIRMVIQTEIDGKCVYIVSPDTYKCISQAKELNGLKGVNYVDTDNNNDTK